ncbi:hypothetical protein KI688_011258 [Linnemannia hyalina]|uniref:Uncharacterized protein n=1 Tax=Linnemannia hyalina TaxID=64524 RepID=A0A9P7XV15_9FUNG|nr:hypothetical protein KI688_011258 [Linnemannia hyalina]
MLVGNSLAPGPATPPSPSAAVAVVSPVISLVSGDSLEKKGSPPGTATATATAKGSLHPEVRHDSKSEEEKSKSLGDDQDSEEEGSDDDDEDNNDGGDVDEEGDDGDDDGDDDEDGSEEDDQPGNSGKALSGHGKNSSSSSSKIPFASISVAVACLIGICAFLIYLSKKRKRERVRAAWVESVFGANGGSGTRRESTISKAIHNTVMLPVPVVRGSYGSTTVATPTWGGGYSGIRSPEPQQQQHNDGYHYRQHQHHHSNERYEEYFDQDECEGDAAELPHLPIDYTPGPGTAPAAPPTRVQRPAVVVYSKNTIAVAVHTSTVMTTPFRTDWNTSIITSINISTTTITTSNSDTRCTLQPDQEKDIDRQWWECRIIGDPTVTPQEAKELEGETWSMQIRGLCCIGHMS